jgi:hypothetical protein
MLMKTKMTLAHLVLLSLVLFSAACTGSGETATAAVQTAEPTVWLTTFVTQIVATVPSPTPTLIPTPTIPPTIPPAWDPWALPIYFPIIDCVASRLHKGDMAFVAGIGQHSRLFATKQIFDDPGRRELQMGETLQIIGGASCSGGWLVWEAYMVADRKRGFVVEGNGDVYWLLPLSPTVPTPKKKPEPTPVTTPMMP